MEKRKLFLTADYKWINGNRIKKSGNHNLTTIREIINSAKKHQWMLELLGESLMRHGTYS